MNEKYTNFFCYFLPHRENVYVCTEIFVILHFILSFFFGLGESKISQPNQAEKRMMSSSQKKSDAQVSLVFV